MTNQDLEQELRSHYRSLDAGSPVRVTSRVADALDRAPADRWNLGSIFRVRWARVAGIAVAAAAVVAIATLPLWSGHFGRPASATATDQAFPPPGPTGSYGLAVGNAEVFQAGMTKDGVVWAAFGSLLSISSDHGITWKNGKLPVENPGDLPGSGTVAVVDANHVWFIRSGTGDVVFTVFRSSDGGATWQSAALPVTPAVQPGVVTFWPAKLEFIDASVGFALVETSEAGDWTILRTQDGGVSWTVTGSDTDAGDYVAVDANSLWVPNENNGYASQPLLQVSRDAGATWSEVQLPGLAATGGDNLLIIPGPTGGVQFVNSTEGYVAVRRKTIGSYETLIFGTTDGGRNWSLLSTLPQALSVAPVVLDATHWCRIGIDEVRNSLVMETSADEGRSWMGASQDNTLPSGAQIRSFWTIDGQHGAAQISFANGGTGEGSLFLTWDGGKSWQPADFSAH